MIEGLLARAAEFAASLGDMRTQVGEIRAELGAHLAGGEGTTATPAAQTTGTPAGRGRGAARPTPGGGAASRTSPTLPWAVAASAAAIVPPAVSAAAPEPAPAVVAPVAAAATPAAPAPEAIPPDAIFSIADPGVSPPKMVYPQLPPPPLVVGGNPHGINVMEVVVGNTGSVERVKLVSQPRRMTDMMLLSGAKMWKFAPASKDGQPVRYRIACLLGDDAVANTGSRFDGATVRRCEGATGTAPVHRRTHEPAPMDLEPSHPRTLEPSNRRTSTLEPRTVAPSHLLVPTVHS